MDRVSDGKMILISLLSLALLVLVGLGVPALRAAPRFDSPTEDEPGAVRTPRSAERLRAYHTFSLAAPAGSSTAAKPGVTSGASGSSTSDPSTAHNSWWFFTLEAGGGYPLYLGGAKHGGMFIGLGRINTRLTWHWANGEWGIGLGYVHMWQMHKIEDNYCLSEFFVVPITLEVRWFIKKWSIALQAGGGFGNRKFETTEAGRSEVPYLSVFGIQARHYFWQRKSGRRLRFFVAPSFELTYAGVSSHSSIGSPWSFDFSATVGMEIR